MAVELLKSVSLANADATPVIFSNARLSGGRLHQAYGVATAALDASIGSIYRLVRVPSNAFGISVFLSNAAFTTTGAADVGVYKANGVVVSAAFFASAQLLTSINLNLEVTNESTTNTIAFKEKPLWEALGLTADPQIDYDIALTLTAANQTTAAAVGLRVTYTR